MCQQILSSFKNVQIEKLYFHFKITNGSGQRFDWSKSKCFSRKINILPKITHIFYWVILLEKSIRFHDVSHFCEFEFLKEGLTSSKSCYCQFQVEWIYCFAKSVSAEASLRKCAFAPTLARLTNANVVYSCLCQIISYLEKLEYLTLIRVT